jgi:nucleotide-binding universal stress UspA family protein
MRFFNRLSKHKQPEQPTSRERRIAEFTAIVQQTEPNPEIVQLMLAPDALARMSDEDLARFTERYQKLRSDMDDLHRMEQESIARMLARVDEVFAEHGLGKQPEEVETAAVTYSVLIIDMAHYQDPDSERTVGGFATLDEAKAYARNRVRSSVEELRSEGQSHEELRKLWSIYGEDAIVIGGEYAGASELDHFIDHPESKE